MMITHPIRFISALLFGLSVIFPGGVAAETKVVKVTAIVEHPALDAVRKGVADELEALGLIAGSSLDWEFQSAQGDSGIAAQIARKFVGDRPDVIVAIATPSAQSVVAAARGTVPVVFSAVTDPVDARLVDNLDSPGANVTGVSDLLPLKKHLGLIREIAEDAKKIGIPYNPGESNAAVLVKRLQQLAPAFGFEIVAAAAPSSGDVLMATRSLVDKVDVIYVTTDNTIISAFESVAKVGIDAQIPVFAGDTDTVSRGAVAAVGFDYYDVGRQTGALVFRVLNGENPGQIPIQGVAKTSLHVNPTAAAKMGFELPPGIIEKASRIVE